MPITSKNPIFLVGCPRSGTTLLQSILAAHSQIASFPESHFFWHLTANRSRWRCKLGLVSVEAKTRLEEFLQELKQGEMHGEIPQYSLLQSSYVQAFVKILDTLTSQQAKALWLEKTPRHLHQISNIEKYLPESKFIHIIRRGEDVVASMYEVTQEHPSLWGGCRDIDECINRWKEDAEISLSHAQKPNHKLVRYEHLVSYTDSVIRDICAFMGVDFEESMLEKYGETAKQVSLKNESWKASVDSGIQSRNSGKFHQVFDARQREYITAKLTDFDWQKLEQAVSLPRELVNEVKA